jgi:GNAT superfamily N-acetyltransferase
MQRFKESRQLHATLFPDLGGDQDLYDLCESTQCQLLTLSTITHGGQLLSYVVFAQTEGKGPPLILFQGVHPAVQRNGVGRWGLQLVYERCGKTRDLLVKIHEERTGFYLHLGFLLRKGSDNSRFPAVGSGIMRRAEVQEHRELFSLLIPEL